MHIAGITAHLTGALVANKARTLLMDLDGGRATTVSAPPGPRPVADPVHRTAAATAVLDDPAEPD